jgi:prepilin-type N-terminal cleavage/methylation domain-containing protein/prepilin-type processing-associated H-X9-DG protein
MARDFSRPRAGFTLIEILVVVAIISLLTNVLLPALSRAREQARSVVCRSNLAQAGRAESTYEATFNGWMVGSPMTTGYFLAHAGAWDPALPGFYKAAVEWFDYATPLRVQTEGSASLPEVTAANAVEVRKNLYKQVTEGLFRCPSNPLIVPPWPATSGYPAIRGVSYLAMSNIVRPGDDAYDRADELFPAASSPGHAAQSDTWEMAVPRGYVPRADRIGQTSIKVFLADGFRYFANPSTLDYTTETTSAKGMMTGEPPSTFVPNNESYDREYVTAKKYSYRHGNGDRINAVFFDGHAESLVAIGVDTVGPFTGPAVHPKWYYPTDTLIQDNSRLHMKDTLAVGTKLP